MAKHYVIDKNGVTKRYPTKPDFNPTQAADSHAGVHGDFEVAWVKKGVQGESIFKSAISKSGWYYWSITTIDEKIYRDRSPYGDPIGPFETSQAAFLAYVAAFDAEIRAGLALS